MAWSLIFAQIIGDGRSTKVAKMMVKFASYMFVWAPYICMGKMLRISNNFFYEASGSRFTQNSSGASLGQGNERLLK